MNLHTCPHCQTPALYEHLMQVEVNCHSCGVAFRLTRYTQTERTRFTRWIEVARLKAQSARRSRQLLYVASLTLLLLLTWSGASMFGLIPDEWRLLNRRFASLDHPETLSQAVGLVVLGRATLDGRIEFTEFFTAAAITHDGFMLTTARALLSRTGAGMWVFIDGRRLDAEPVDLDSIADIGIIKVSETLHSRFRLAEPATVRRLNIEVASIGFPDRGTGNTSPLRQSYSVSRGTISHVSTDETGTEWIDHSAAIDAGGIGGPLVLGDRIVGLNVGSRGVIMKAISVGPLRTRLLRMIDESRSRSSRQ